MSDAEDLVTVVVGEQAVPQAPAPQQSWPLDEICAAAAEVARQALLEEVEAAQVGEALGLVAEGPHVVTHFFAGHVPGYTGWRWAVTVARAPDSEHVTVDETALLPDGSALLAPAWVPWKQRIESGDLGAGDVMVTEPDDSRLVAGFTDNDVPVPEDALQPPQWELGLGRVRMLSPEGRREAAHRWYREAGPRSPIARAADLHCGTCGFLLLIGGPLGQAFGVCANGFSPVDGRVVAMTFGCGAHSETVEKPAVGVAEIVIDEVGYDSLPDSPADDAGADAGSGREQDSAQPDAPDDAAPATAGGAAAAQPEHPTDPPADPTPDAAPESPAMDPAAADSAHDDSTEETV